MKATLDLAWALTGLQMHFIVPLETLSSTPEEKFLLRHKGRDWSLPYPLMILRLPTKGRA